MGEVHRAYDTARTRTVALKRLHPHLREPAFEQRFRLEARAAAQLSSPHVVPIHDFGEIDGQLFIDMRLIDGVDLAVELTRTGPMNPARAVELVRQLADALDSAHHAGLVHRDVKPSNAVLAAAGGRDFAYLVDFGIVRAAGDTSHGPGHAPGGGSAGAAGAALPPGAPLTGTGMVIGKLTYMAPELFEGARASVASDVYAMGCLLYETLTAHAPFTGDGATLMRQHLHSPPPHPTRLRPQIPSALADVVTAALAKDPTRRPATAGALASAAHAAVLAAASPTWASPIGARPGGGGSALQAAIDTWVPSHVPARSSALAGPPYPAPSPPGGRAPERTEGVFTGPRLRAAVPYVCTLGVLAYLVWGVTSLRCTIEGTRPCNTIVVPWASTGAGLAMLCLGAAIYGWLRGHRLQRRNAPSAVALAVLVLSPYIAGALWLATYLY